MIPSVKQLQKQSDQESLLYKTRLWAKTALEETLENYAAFREEEAAREEAARVRADFNSVGSDEMQFSFGSEEELEDLTFAEGDADYEDESYYYPEGYMSPLEGRSRGGTAYGQQVLLPPMEEPADEFIDPMDELKSLVHSVSEYLAVKEKEIDGYEQMPKSQRRKLPPLPTEAQTVDKREARLDGGGGDSAEGGGKCDVKEDSPVEQGIAGVKTAMSSLLSSITGSKSPTEPEGPRIAPPPQPPQTDSSISKLLSFIPKGSPESTETSATGPPTSQTPPQPESSITKLLAFIPKSGGPPPPVAIVPPASQEPATEKKFSFQSLMPFQSSEPAGTNQASPKASTEAADSGAASKQSMTGIESVFGRLSPMRLFSSAPPSREPSPQSAEQRNASGGGKDSQPVSRAPSPHRAEHQPSSELQQGSGSVDLLPDTGSGSVELLPETESSGELPDSLQRGAVKVSDPKQEATAEETGFFSPFRKSLSTLISTVPPENSSQTDSRPAEESFLGSKLKIPFFSDIAATAPPPKAEGSMLSGILRFATGEDSNTVSKSPSPAPAGPAAPNCTAQLESGPKANAETGWFSNLFKVPPTEASKEPPKKQLTPSVPLTRQTEPQNDQKLWETAEKTPSSAEQTSLEQTACEVNVSQDQSSLMSAERKLQPEAPQCPKGDAESNKKIQRGDSQPQQGGLFSGLFSSASPSPQTEQHSAGQQAGGLLSGFLKFASETVSAPTDHPITAEHQSGQAQGQPAASEPVSGGLLSGLLKRATDTVSVLQPPQSCQESHPVPAEPTNTLDQDSTKASVGPLQGSIKPGSGEGPAPEKIPPDQQEKQPVVSNPQPNQKQQIAPPKTTTAGTQPAGLFGGLLKLSEPASPQPSQAPPNQGSFLSGLFGMGNQDSVPVNQPQSSQNQPSHPVKTGIQSKQQPGNRQNLQRQHQVPPQQQPSGPGGMLTGWFNKIADVGTQQPAAGAQPAQQQAQRQGPPTTQQPQNQQGGFLSGLFSAGPSPPAQQQPSAVQQNQQQSQQSNRQPLRRQNQIPPQPVPSAPEPQQGGLLSGFLNKLASGDSVPQQPSTQASSQQANKTASQSTQEGGFLTSLFGQSPPQQQQEEKHPPQPTANQQSTAKQPAQSGGVLSGILKLAPGNTVPSDHQSPQLSQAGEPPKLNPAKPESAGLFSGFLNKISSTIEQPSPTTDPTSCQATQQQQLPHVGHARPHIQRTKQIDVHSTQEATSDKDLKGRAQKNVLPGISTSSEEPHSKTQEQSPVLSGKEEPKASLSSSSQSLLSRILKTDSNKEKEGVVPSKLQSTDGISSSSSTPTTASDAANAMVENGEGNFHSQSRQDPTMSLTLRYLEELQRLLYGTENEYGYKDLLYNFTEHGVLPAELYEHQCLIEALLWQQLNEYVLAEALASPCQNKNQPLQGHTPPPLTASLCQNHVQLNPQEMNITAFDVPSHPWRHSAAHLFESRNRFLDTDEDLVLFDMTCRDRKPWSSCDNLKGLGANRNLWTARGDALDLSTEKVKSRLSRCQSLTECSASPCSKAMENSSANKHLNNETFDLKTATAFLKRLAAKKGPVDLRRGALNLSTSVAAAGEADADAHLDDTEWYQQWLSLLEQGLWWPAEVGDCGYYVYTHGDYIYSLLTDKSGGHLYACATEEDMQALGNITENIATILKQKETDKVTLCGFKIPLNDEGEDFWTPHQQENKSLASEAAVDLSSALSKGEKLMNMNLESFSQMFQESLSSQPVDFTVYKLKKIKTESVQSGFSCREEPIEAADFSLKSLKGGRGGPYWKEQAVKDVLLPSPSLSSVPSPRQTSPATKTRIPEIKIGCVDDTDHPHARQRADLKPSYNTTETDKLSRTPTSSNCVSRKPLDTSKIVSATSLVSKIPGPVQMEKKLPSPPSTSTHSTAPPQQALTDPSISSQRPFLTRQPSQAAQPRVFSLTNGSTATGKQRTRSAPGQTCCQAQNLQQEPPKKVTPKLNILNDTGTASSEAYLFNRNQKALYPYFDSHIGNKVLDFSPAVAKNTGQAIAAEASVEAKKQTEIVDYTKYKLKRFKEKKLMDCETNVDLSNNTGAAVALVKQTEEEDAEGLNLDVEYPKLSSIQERPVVHQMSFGHNNKSERRVSKSSLPHIPGLPDSRGASKETGMSHTDQKVHEKSARTVSSTMTSAPGTAISTLDSSSSGTSILDGHLKQKAKPEAPLPICSSPLLSPVIKKQVDMQEQKELKPQTPSIPSARKILCDTKGQASRPLYQSCEKIQGYQTSTGPANLIKAALDMSVKTKAQQVEVPSMDPVCEALPLTRRKQLASVKTDKTSQQESIDLTSGPLSPESHEQKPAFIILTTLEEPSGSGMTTKDTAMKNFTSSKEVAPALNIPVNLPSGDFTVSSPSSAQLDCSDSVLNQHSKHGVLSPLTSLSFAPRQTIETSFSNAAVTAVLDMSPKLSPEVLNKTEGSPDEAVSLLNKPSVKAALRRGSVGIPLVVEPKLLEPRKEKTFQNVLTAQKWPNANRVTLPFLQQQPVCNVALHQSGFSQSTFQTYTWSSAPANSVKGTVDMSTKAGKSETAVQCSDILSLVCVRPSDLTDSQTDPVGVPLIVKAQHSQEFPKMQQTTVVRPQRDFQQRFVSGESKETTAPANSIRGFLDMSPKSQQQQLETPETPVSGILPLIRNKTSVCRNDSAGVSLVVEPAACQQRQRNFGEITMTETVHRLIPPYYCSMVLSGSKTRYKHAQPQNKPMDFSAKDRPARTNDSSSRVELKTGEPVNFTNRKLKQDSCERRQTATKLGNKKMIGAVDLTLDKKTSACDHQEVKDVVPYYISFSSQYAIYLSQQSIHSASTNLGRTQALLSETQMSSLNGEYSAHEQTQTKPEMHQGRKSITGQGQVSPSPLASTQAHQMLQNLEWKKPSPDVAYPQVNNEHVQSKRPESLSTHLLTQSQISQQQFQHSSLEPSSTSSTANSQPLDPVLTHQGSGLQRETAQRPKVLLKQITVDSYGSTEEYDDGSRQAPSAISLSPQHAGHQAVPPSVSFGSQTGTPLQSRTALPVPGVMQPQGHVTVQPHQAVTVQPSSPPSVQSTSPVSTAASQPAVRPEAVMAADNRLEPTSKEQQAGETGSTSVKGLISLYTGLESQSAVSSYHAETVSQPVDHSRRNTSENMVDPATPVPKAPGTNASLPQSPSLSGLLPCTEVPVKDQYKITFPPVTPEGFSTQPAGDESAAMQVEPPSSQNHQQPQRPVKEALEEKSSSVELADTETLEGSPCIDGSSKPSQTLSEEMTKETFAVTNEIDFSQQPRSEEAKQSKLEDVTINVKASAAVLQTENKKIHPKSVYIGIHSSEVPSTGVEHETNEPKPHMRLPHIFVSAASSPEEETDEHEFSECSKPDLSKVGVPEETILGATTPGDWKDPLPETVAQSDISEDVKSVESINNNASIEPFGRDSCVPEFSEISDNQTRLEEQGSKCLLTEKISPVEATISELKGKVDPSELQLPMISPEEKSTSDVAQLEAAEPAGHLACQAENTSLEEKTSKDVQLLQEMTEKDKDASSETVIPQEVQHSCSLSLKEEPSVAKTSEEVQEIQDKAESEVSTSVPEPSPVTLPAKDDGSATKANETKAQQSEQTGRGIFSLFSNSTAMPQQTSSPSGPSGLCASIPGPTAKETSGTGLLSMFGAPPSTDSKNKLPQSVPQEPQGKGLLSMFGVSTGQSPPRGPVAGSSQPKGPLPREPPGKGLFSMFGSSPPQPTPSPRSHVGIGVPPRGPPTGSSLFGGILTGSSMQKESPGIGLFSKFGGVAAQSQTGPKAPGPTATPPRTTAPEISAKGLMTISGEQGKQASEVPATSQKSDSIFKASSVFSLGENSDSSKLKTGFGLFGMSFLGETKTEPEPEPVKPKETEVVLEKSDDCVPSESLPPSFEEEVRVQQECNDLQEPTKDVSTNSETLHKVLVRKSDLCEEVHKDTKQELSLSNISTDLPEKLRQVDQHPVGAMESVTVGELTEEKCISDVEKTVPESDKDILQTSSTDGESVRAQMKSPTEQKDSSETPETLIDSVERPTGFHAADVADIKSVSEGEESLTGSEKEAEKPVKSVTGEEETIKKDVEAPDETFKTPNEEQPADMEKLKDEALKVEEHQADADAEKSNNEALTVAAEEMPVNVDSENSFTKELVVQDTEEVTRDMSMIKTTEKPTAEVKPEATAEDLNLASSETVQEPTDAKVQVSTLEKTFEKDSSFEVGSNEDRSVEESTSMPSCPTQQQARPVPICPPGPQMTDPSMADPRMTDPRMADPRMAGPRMGDPRMADPRMAGPRMADPRMAGPRMGDPRMAGPYCPRQQGQQKPPEPAPFSGFMSMFSSPSASSKSPTVGGFFSSSPGSLFGSASAPRQPQQQQQQKTLFFGLSSGTTTESLTSDLFGMFRGPEATKAEQPKQPDTDPEPKNPPESRKASEGTEDAECRPGLKKVQSTENSETSESGRVEVAKQKDEADTEANDSSVPAPKCPSSSQEHGYDEHLEETGPAQSEEEAPPSAPNAKAAFDKPPLSTTKLDFMSVTTQGTAAFGSLFSSTSPTSAVHLPQQCQTDSGLFAGLKTLSANIFQDEKPAAKDDASGSLSNFGLKLTSVFGSSESPKPESTSPNVTAQTEPESLKDESDKPSPGSEETESADTSETEGPTETSKTGSCDTLAQTPQSGCPSLTDSLDKPQPKKKTEEPEARTSGSWHDGLAAERPKTLLAEEAAKSPPDSSHRDSSGNLSPTSSQPSSELQGVQRVEPRPPRGNDSWNEDDVEKEVHAPPEPGSNKDLQENLSVASADICEEKRPPISSEATPPPCSPSRVRWLKAYNKVREKLLQSPHLQGDPNKQPWAKPGGNAPFGIDSMPDLRRRRPISLVGELVSAAAKTLPTWFPADLW
ncbi:uncharacterized protein LOC144981294 isoform X1 [Oryzias latipes]